MTVTRKDLNVIAATFNQRIILKAGKLKDKCNTRSDILRIRFQVIAIWHTAEAMFSTLQQINPATDYGKWRKAVTKNLEDFEVLDLLSDGDFRRRTMTNRDCEQLAYFLYQSKLDSETVKRDDVRMTRVFNDYGEEIGFNAVDVSMITDSDWDHVLEHLGCIETIKG